MSGYAARPTSFHADEARPVPIYGVGLPGMRYDERWELARVDEGTVRVRANIGSRMDGLVFNLALRTTNVHPWIVVLDANGLSYIAHAGKTLTRIEHPVPLPRGEPTWVWYRYTHGTMEVGLGAHPGHNTIMSARTPQTLGGGYLRVGFGKTATNGVFELLDVQSLERTV